MPGTREFHCYIPSQDGTLKVSRVSGDENPLTVKVFNLPMAMAPDSSDSNDDSGADVASNVTRIDLQSCDIGSYVGCTYDGKWWVGVIRDM